MHAHCTTSAVFNAPTSAFPLRRRAQVFEPWLTPCVTKKEHFYFSDALTETQSTELMFWHSFSPNLSIKWDQQTEVKGTWTYLNPPVCSKPRPSMPLLFPAIPNISCLLLLEDPVLKASNSPAFSPYSWILIVRWAAGTFPLPSVFLYSSGGQKKPRRDTRFLNCPKMPLTNWLVFTDSQFHCRGLFFFPTEEKAMPEEYLWACTMGKWLVKVSTAKHSTDMSIC